MSGQLFPKTSLVKHRVVAFTYRKHHKGKCWSSKAKQISPNPTTKIESLNSSRVELNTKTTINGNVLLYLVESQPNSSNEQGWWKRDRNHNPQKPQPPCPRKAVLRFGKGMTVSRTAISNWFSDGLRIRFFGAPKVRCRNYYWTSEHWTEINELCYS